MTEVSSVPSYGSYYSTAYYNSELCNVEDRSTLEINPTQPAEDLNPPLSELEGGLEGAFAFTPIACGAKTGLWVEDMWVEDPVDGGSDTGTDVPQDVSDDAFDYYDTSETSDDGVDADGDSMPDEVPSDIHEVGDESIVDVPEDTSDYYDASETEESCERTCEPGPCSSILEVPDEYPTIQQAIDVAQMGDMVQIEEGEYIQDEPIIMRECVHLFGDLAYVGATNIIREGLPGTGCDDGINATIIMADRSSLNHLSVQSEGGCALYFDDISGRVNNCQLTGYVAAEMHGNSEPQIFGGGIDGLSGLQFYDFSSGNIERNDFSDNLVWGIITRDASSPIVRDNIFQSENAACQVCISDFSAPDLGTDSDPGENLFYRRRYAEEPGGGCFHWPLIGNQSVFDIQAFGNFYDEYAIYCGGEEYQSTYDEMLAHPDPYDPEANITTIYDIHDSEIFGRVLYQGFGPASEH